MTCRATALRCAAADRVLGAGDVIDAAATAEPVTRDALHSWAARLLAESDALAALAEDER